MKGVKITLTLDAIQLENYDGDFKGLKHWGMGHSDGAEVLLKIGQGMANPKMMFVYKGNDGETAYYQTDVSELMVQLASKAEQIINKTHENSNIDEEEQDS